jgi:hypothetical protein
MAEADWKAALPDDLKGAPALKDVKDVGALAKSYLEAQTALGGSVRLPSKEAGEDGRKAFRARMLEVGKDHGLIPLPGEADDDAAYDAYYTASGRPKEAKEYVIPDAKAEGLVFDPAEAETFKEVAHRAGLTPRQFKKVVSDMAKAREAGTLASKSKFEADHAALKADWSAAHDTRRGETQRLLATHKAPEALQNAFKEGLVDADSTRWLYGVMSALGDEPFEMQSQGKGSGSRLTSDEAMARVTEVEARIAKMNAGDPDYEGLLKRRLELLELAGAS